MLYQKLRIWFIYFLGKYVKISTDKYKKALKKNKFLYKYRIVQIKEKFGGLRWYDAGIPKDSKIFDIIAKYAEISYKTCGVCGKPATKMTKGWIYPYCDNCIGDRDFTEIK